MNAPELTSLELKAEMDAGRVHLLLDVRRADELEVSRLDHVVHIPMDQVPSHINELDQSADIVVVCRSGQRSARVTNYLLGLGFPRVRNLSDGMNGWASTVDPSMPVY